MRSTLYCVRRSAQHDYPVDRKQLNEMLRRKSADDVPALVDCVRELQDVLERSLREGGHAEDCALLKGRACNCWVREAVEAECAEK